MPAALRLQEPLTLGLRLCFSMTSDRHDASTGWWRGGGPMSSLLFWLRIGAVHKGRWVERVQVHSTLAISFVVGILLALLIAAGAFILLISQR